MQIIQQLEIKRPPFTGGLMGLSDLTSSFFKSPPTKDLQGLYYVEVFEKRHQQSIIDNSHQHEVTVKRKKRHKKLTGDELKMALSIVGMIKDDIEPDLSKRFREYLYGK
jgi:hypothetical protein